MSGSKKTTGSSKSRFSTVPPKVAGKSSTPATSETPKAIVPVTREVPAEQPKAAAPETVVASKPMAVATPVAAAAPKVSQEQFNQWTASVRDVSAEVAQLAAKKLGESGDHRAVQTLISVVRNADGYFHSGVRAAAAEALGQLGDRSAVDALIGAIGDPMAEASAEAVRALATLNDQRAVSPLLDVVRNANGYYLPVVRRAAVLALARLGGREAQLVIAEAAANGQEDPAVRDAALKSTSRTSN